MNTERVDLSALDTAADRERWERLVRGIMMRAAPELARRAADQDPFELLGSWARPMIAAAATVAVVAASMLLQPRGPVELATSASSGVVEALRVPMPAADWLAEDRSPTVTDVITALESNQR